MVQYARGFPLLPRLGQGGVKTNFGFKKNKQQYAQGQCVKKNIQNNPKKSLFKPINALLLHPQQRSRSLQY